MDYKVCILTAGTGSRMGGFTKYFNKALIPINGKPAISHIIDRIEKDVEIVIALGYMGEQVKTFLLNAYPKRKFTFCVVDKFTGEGSGPGYSLYQCKDDLQCPFIYESADTLIKENIPEPNENWFGVSKVSDPKRFCTVTLDGEKIKEITDKEDNENEYAFIGIGGIKDYDVFWDRLGKDKTLTEGEIQASNGFKSLIERGLKMKNFTWWDTGTDHSYAHAQENFPNGEPFSGE